MWKFMLPAAVLTSIGLFVSDDASAGWRRDYRRSHTVIMTPAPVAVAPSTAPPVASRSTAPSYRCFSYEPAPAARPYVAPLAPSQSHFFRADRKTHDPLWYRVQ
jgi:hypothetical protein